MFSPPTGQMRGDSSPFAWSARRRQLRATVRIRGKVPVRVGRGALFGDIACCADAGVGVGVETQTRNK